MTVNNKNETIRGRNVRVKKKTTNIKGRFVKVKKKKQKQKQKQKQTTNVKVNIKIGDTPKKRDVRRNEPKSSQRSTQGQVTQIQPINLAFLQQLSRSGTSASEQATAQNLRQITDNQNRFQNRLNLIETVGSIQPAPPPLSEYSSLATTVQPSEDSGSLARTVQPVEVSGSLARTVQPVEVSGSLASTVQPVAGPSSLATTVPMNSGDRVAPTNIKGKDNADKMSSEESVVSTRFGGDSGGSGDTSQLDFNDFDNAFIDQPPPPPTKKKESSVEDLGLIKPSENALIVPPQPPPTKKKESSVEDLDLIKPPENALIVPPQPPPPPTPPTKKKESSVEDLDLIKPPEVVKRLSIAKSAPAQKIPISLQMSKTIPLRITPAGELQSDYSYTLGESSDSLQRAKKELEPQPGQKVATVADMVFLEGEDEVSQGPKKQTADQKLKSIEQNVSKKNFARLNALALLIKEETGMKASDARKQAGQYMKGSITFEQALQRLPKKTVTMDQDDTGKIREQVKMIASVGKAKKVPTKVKKSEPTGKKSEPTGKKSEPTGKNSVPIGKNVQDFVDRVIKFENLIKASDVEKTQTKVKVRKSKKK